MKIYIKKVLKNVTITPYLIFHIGALYTFIGALGTAFQFLAMRNSGNLSYRSVFADSFESLVISAVLFLTGALAVSLMGREKEDQSEQ